MEKEYTLVYFNTQTTGLDKPSICELAAEVDAKDYPPFHKYILPTKQVAVQARDKNHLQLSADGKQLLLKGKAVDTCTLEDALNEFLTWLKEIINPVLVDHYVPYHIDVLNRAFANFPRLGQQYDEAVKGTGDTLELFKMIYPPRTTLTREALAAKILGDSSYKKNTAQGHVQVLRQLIKSKGVTKATILQFMKSKPDTPRNTMDGNSPSEGMGYVDSSLSVKRKRKNKEKIGNNGKEIKRKKRKSDEDSYQTVKTGEPCSPLERMSSGDTLQKSKKLDRTKQETPAMDKKDKKRKKRKTSIECVYSRNQLA